MDRSANNIEQYKVAREKKALLGDRLGTLKR
jgi:hypothetical protein